MVGGKGESHANIGEGLATALQCFEDLQVRREPNVASQKHCVLVCNLPPYQIGVQESYAFVGYTVEQLAGLFQEVRKLELSDECIFKSAQISLNSFCFTCFARYTKLKARKYKIISYSKHL